jgi:hypothetical protein
VPISVSSNRSSRTLRRRLVPTGKFSKIVHKKIKKVVPRHNMIRSFQTNRVKEMFEEIIYYHRDLLTSDIGQGTQVKVLDGDDSDDDIITLIGEKEEK